MSYEREHFDGEPSRQMEIQHGLIGWRIEDMYAAISLGPEEQAVLSAVESQNQPNYSLVMFATNINEDKNGVSADTGPHEEFNQAYFGRLSIPYDEKFQKWFIDRLPSYLKKLEGNSVYDVIELSSTEEKLLVRFLNGSCLSCSIERDGSQTLIKVTNSEEISGELTTAGVSPTRKHHLDEKTEFSNFLICFSHVITSMKLVSRDIHQTPLTQETINIGYPQLISSDEYRAPGTDDYDSHEIAGVQPMRRLFKHFRESGPEVWDTEWESLGSMPLVPKSTKAMLDNLRRKMITGRHVLPEYAEYVDAKNRIFAVQTNDPERMSEVMAGFSNSLDGWMNSISADHLETSPHYGDNGEPLNSVEAIVKIIEDIAEVEYKNPVVVLKGLSSLGCSPEEIQTIEAAIKLLDAKKHRSVIAVIDEDPGLLKEFSQGQVFNSQIHCAIFESAKLAPLVVAELAGHDLRESVQDKLSLVAQGDINAEAIAAAAEEKGVPQSLLSAVIREVCGAIEHGQCAPDSSSFIEVINSL